MAPSRAALRLSRSALHSFRPTTAVPVHPISQQQTRGISAYGYEQAKCLAFASHGEPHAALKLHTHSIAPPHRDLVNLRFLASPINPADINQLQGVYPSKPVFSNTLGSATPLAVGGNEGVAEVLSVGSGVKSLTKGDWVVMKAPSFGTWRTHAQTTPDALLRIHNRTGLTPAQAGTVSVNPLTAYRLLRDFGTLQPGDWVIQNGANSGVGRAAIQLARLWGLKTLNIIRGSRPDVDALKAELEGLGADLVVTDAELSARGIRDRIAEATNGGREKIRLGLNCVGGEVVSAMTKQLAPGSALVTYGAMSKQPLTLATGPLIFKNLRFEGFWVSRWASENPEAKDRCVQEMLNLIREGNFRDVPMVPVRWGAETKETELVEAVQGTLEGYRKGKGIFVFEE